MGRTQRLINEFLRADLASSMRLEDTMAVVLDFMILALASFSFVSLLSLLVQLVCFSFKNWQHV